MILLFYLLQILFAIVLYIIDIEYNLNYIRTLSFLAIIDSFIFLIFRRNVSYRRVPVILLFLIGYLIVFFQKYIDLSLGYIHVDDKVFVSETVLMRCVLLSFIGLLSFFIGILSARKYNKIIYKDSKEININPLRNIICLFTILFIIFNYPTLLTASYSQELLEEQAGTLSLYSNVLVQISLFLYFSYLVYNDIKTDIPSFFSYIHRVGVKVNVCVFFYLLYFLLLGDRGYMIVIALLYLGTYMLLSRKIISWKSLLVAFIFSIFIFSFIGKVRGDNSTLSLHEKITYFFDEGDVQSLSPMTLELANSVNTLHISVYNVPDIYPFFYGSFQVRQFFSAIPFMNHFVYEVTDNHFKNRSSAFFITWLFQGDFYTYGSGTSCNADLYLSFGCIGIILGLFILGRIFATIECKMLTSKYLSLMYIILYLYFLSYSIYINRASLLCFFNFFVFTLFLHVFYSKVIINKKR